MIQSCTIEASARLHIGLIDVSGIAKTQPGGAGLAIAGEKTHVRAIRAATNRFESKVPLDERGLAEGAALIERLSEWPGGGNAYFILESHPEQHAGLGSKTALLLSLIAAANCLFDLRMTRREAQLLCGRGGTSGVGINTFFSGGVIVDAGRPNWNPSPSSATRPAELPTVVYRTELPPPWRVVLLRPTVENNTREQETEFFRKNIPMPQHEAYATMAAVYHGFVPAVDIGDYPLLRESLSMISNSGFKRLEIARYGSAVAQLLEAMNGLGIACGMSSMGPYVFGIAEGDGPLESVKQLGESMKAVYRGPYCPQNQGHRVTVE